MRVGSRDIILISRSQPVPVWFEGTVDVKMNQKWSLTGCHRQAGLGLRCSEANEFKHGVLRM